MPATAKTTAAAAKKAPAKGHPARSPGEPAGPTPKPAISPLQATIELARRGNTEVLPQLRQALDERPDIWRQCGDLAGRLQAAWLNLIAPTNLLLQESARRRVDEERASLAGPSASPLELVLAERIVATQLQVTYFEGMVAKYEGKSNDKTMDYLQRRCDEANRRLREAITTLARVRKLLPRPIRVEVAVTGKVEATVKTRRSRRKGRQTTRGRAGVQNRLERLLSGSRSIN